MNDSLRDDIDTLCDVYMMPSQLAALDRIIALATLTAATSGGVPGEALFASDEVNECFDYLRVNGPRLIPDEALEQMRQHLLTAALKDGGAG